MFNKASKIFAAALIAVAVQPVFAETLRVGTECTYAPFNYRTPDGELTGYDIDVAKGVGAELGVEIKFVCQKWDGMIPALQSQKFDLIIASMSITEKRLEKIDFSIPYRISVGRFIGRKNAGLNLFNNDGSANPGNFRGIKVGLPRASTYENWLQAKVPDANVLLYDSTEAMYLDLENGRADVIMSNPMKGYLKFLSKPNGAGFEFVSPALSEKKFFGSGVGIGVRKGNRDLVKRLDDALKKLIVEGDLKKYSLKYFPFPINPEDWEGISH